MKVLYIFSSAGLQGSSVQTKVINQIAGLKKNGVDCTGLFFTTDTVLPDCVNQDYKFITVPVVKKGYFRSVRQRNACHKRIYQYFEETEPKFDYIYFRYDHASKSVLTLTKKYRKKIFFEHVTAEQEEIKLYRNENPLKLKLSSLLGNLEFLWIPLLRENLWGKRIRQNALFGICNSCDIAKIEEKIANGKYKTILGGDAVKTSDYMVRNPIPPLEREFKIAFLKGASTRADFNGLDRIFKGIKNYSGPYIIKLFLFGKNLHSETKMIESEGILSHVELGAYIGKKESEALMQNTHIGVSAMGLHRKGIKSTTTIKSREYFAQGIPFIFGHHDPDLSDSTIAMEYCLQFDANDKPIDFTKVINWFTQVNSIDGYPMQMRHFAETSLDYTVKMKKLKKHLEDA